MSKKIAVIGSSNTDMIIQTQRIPRPGETILGGRFSIASGGKGANQAVASARAGGDVSFIARVGDDMFGKTAIEGFEKDKINTEHIIIDKNQPSGVAFIFVADDGENSIGVASGANANLSVNDINKTSGIIRSADILLMQLEIPVETVEYAVSLANKHGTKVILNPAPAQALSDSLLQNVFIFTPNETEAEFFTGLKIEKKGDAQKAADVLLKKNINTVIITLGAKGALIATTSKKEFVPGFKVNAVDTTAAGDVFNGTLAVAIAEGKELEHATSFANAAAALSVTRLGAQPSAPDLNEILKFMQDNLIE